MQRSRPHLPVRSPRLVQVCVLVPREGGYFREVVLGLIAIAASRGWMLNVFTGWRQARCAVDAPYDVLVLAGQKWRSLRGEQRRGQIVVGADLDLCDEGIPSVVVDNELIGVMAADHFLSRGFRSTAVFGQSRFFWCRQRADAFRRRVEGSGFRCSEWVRDSRQPGLANPYWAAPENVKQWLGTLAKPVGIFATCDSWAAIMADCCRMSGLRVPEDVAIVGVDNDEVTCRRAAPPLSSVALPLRKLGNEVGLMVDRLLAGQKPTEDRVVLQPTGVVTRRSSDVLAVEDPDVAAALAVIRNHSDRPLSVSEILRQIPASQNRLERGFKRYLGRTMIDEIRRVHVEQAKQLLVGTDLPMYEIAERCGFASQTKLAVAFKRETSLTPTGYRERFRPVAGLP